MPVTLPSFSRGLSLVRIAAFVMLLQLAASIVLTIKGFGADTLDDARSTLKWTQYLVLVNGLAVIAMLVGVARAIPELRRAGQSIRGLVISTLGFAVATGALLWSYRALAAFVGVFSAPEPDLDAVLAAASDLESAKYLMIARDAGYGIALVTLIGTIQRSAAINEQIGLADEAASTGRAFVVLVVGDLFYQFTYGLAEGGIGIVSVIAALLVLGYWVYCHLRLARFLENAAYFVNEPHDLPAAKVVRGGDVQVPRPPPPVKPAKVPSPAPVVVTALAPAPPPAPRADSELGTEPAGDGPQFLR